MNVFVLIWFLVTPAGNQLIISEPMTLDACRHAGDEMYAKSQAAQDAKEITTFGGTCYEVPVVKHVPGKDEA